MKKILKTVYFLLTPLQKVCSVFLAKFWITMKCYETNCRYSRL